MTRAHTDSKAEYSKVKALHERDRRREEWDEETEHKPFSHEDELNDWFDKQRG